MKECDNDDGDEANTLLVQRITPLVSTSITTTQGNGEGDAGRERKGEGEERGFACVDDKRRERITSTLHEAGSVSHWEGHQGDWTGPG